MIVARIARGFITRLAQATELAPSTLPEGMRRIGVAIAAVALAATLAPATHADAPTVIRLISNFHHADIVLDRAPRGEAGTGDVLVSVNRLRNATGQFGRPKGALVGQSRGRFTFVSGTNMRVDGWTTLPGGRLHIRGLTSALGYELLTMRVVGGTGAFAGARGTVTVRPYPTTARTLVVYRLRLS